jgi:acetyl-CoA C-acetyltransferase
VARLAGVHPADLAGKVLAGLVDRSGIDPAAVEDIIMGCACPIRIGAGVADRVKKP